MALLHFSLSSKLYDTICKEMKKLQLSQTNCIEINIYFPDFIIDNGNVFLPI